jgi:carboxylate-amine ligase
MQATATTTPDPRYARMSDVFGETARTALSCGMHVHVGVSSRAEGVRVVNGIRRWLPVLLALSTNSPFHEGRDTGYHSYRSSVWQHWPTAGPTGTFDGIEDYDLTRQALIDTGAALDDGMLYFDARLSASYPTVEIRVADVCVRPADAAALAGVARGLVDAAAAGALPAGPTVLDRAELLRAMMWRAARDGMTGTLVHPGSGQLVPAWSLVDELLDLVPLGDDDGVVRDALAVIRAEGTGSALQRRSYERTGSLAAVVDELAERMSA